MDSPSSESQPGVVAVLAAFLRRVEAGEPADLEALCAAHPKIADELRALFVHWNAVGGLRAALGIGGSVGRGLRERYGSDADPHVSLDRKEPGSSADEFARGVVGRLGARTGAFGRYRLSGELARGGQGVVLRVWDEDLRRNLAMKLALSPAEDEAIPDSRPLGRFLEEAQVTAQLDHPGIVPVHELGLDAEGRVYFTMKLVKGESFGRVLEKTRDGLEGWTRTRVLGVLLKVCEAVSYAHAKGVLHRDLKPSNVMVGRFGEVYVMDWGLSRVLGREEVQAPARQPGPRTADIRSERREVAATASSGSSLVTLEGEIMGTPDYMPPEQALGQLERMGRYSDVYSVGAMLYQLLAGHRPYEERDQRLSGLQILYRVQCGPPPPIQERAADAPGELVAICERAMARNPSERYPDMAALADELRAFLEGRVVRAFESGPWAEARKWVGRNRALAVALAAGVLLLVAGLVTALFLRSRAVLSAEEARVAREAADRARVEAETERADVLRLSARQDVDDLMREQSALWPPYPERLPAYRGWLARARALLADLPLHRAKLAELRALALPRPEEQHERERRAHPDFARLEGLSARIAVERRALAVRRGEAEVELPALDESTLPEDRDRWDIIAWDLVEPERKRFGEEGRGVVLAEEALASASVDVLPSLLDTIAWGRLALGDDEAALEASREALESAPPEKKAEYRDLLRRITEATGRAGTEAGLAEAEERIARLEEERAALDARVDERVEWAYPERREEAHWWQAQLAGLVRDLETLEREQLDEEAILPPHAWSVARRMAFAERLEQAFAEGGEHAEGWRRALPAIHSAYPGLELGMQLGLVPLGPDPDSGLWEFAHLASGEPAVRDPEGRLVVREETGVVLVLVPAGSFWMGSQATDPAGRNYCPDAVHGESPVHEVELSAYFLSKYEMTQAQWQRATGTNPSAYGVDGAFGGGWNRDGAPPSRLHPVELVSWSACREVCARLDLALPSEAQWECACRAGTGTAYWCGDEVESLADVGNVADRWAKEHGGGMWGAHESIDDGHTAHAAIGSYRANPFGFSEMHGNVSEWCLDGNNDNSYNRERTPDPVVAPENEALRIFRGGGFNDPAERARSSSRSSGTPDYASPATGLRPARPVRTGHS